MEVKGQLGVKTGCYVSLKNVPLFLTEHVMFLKVDFNIPQVVLLSGCAQILDARSLEVKMGKVFELQFFVMCSWVETKFGVCNQHLVQNNVKVI